ncbi:AraC family transcriptional regulator [Streptomyces sp. CC219B]|uniref:AraC family transcriptional regulator n=1 Tax=Streptomyces sp. CC219B TaxID=3044574 RepID=UPI0024A80B8D|nr:AraC family transcriptional regulator [Streptomyces sp. CC219B]
MLKATAVEPPAGLKSGGIMDETTIILGGRATVTRGLGPLRVLTEERGARDPLRHEGTDAPLVAAGTLAAGSAVLSYGGHALATAPGDLFVVDLVEPWRLNCSDGSRLHLFLVPRVVFGVSAQELGRLRGVHAASTDGVLDLLVPLLVTAAESAETYPPHVGRGIAGSIVDLLEIMAVGAGTERGGPGGALTDERGNMADRIGQFVNENLQNPELGPELVADRLRVSIRYVHKVFEAEGTTLSRWIRERRLHECRRELARTGGAGPSVPVSAVARRWGFTNASHFSRAFRTLYGLSPSEWQHLRGGVTV